MIRRPPRSTQSRSSAASDVYKRQSQSSSSLSAVSGWPQILPACSCSTITVIVTEAQSIVTATEANVSRVKMQSAKQRKDTEITFIRRMHRLRMSQEMLRMSCPKVGSLAGREPMRRSAQVSPRRVKAATRLSLTMAQTSPAQLTDSNTRTGRLARTHEPCQAWKICPSIPRPSANLSSTLANSRTLRARRPRMTRWRHNQEMIMMMLLRIRNSHSCNRGKGLAMVQFLRNPNASRTNPISTQSQRILKASQDMATDIFMGTSICVESSFT